MPPLWYSHTLVVWEQSCPPGMEPKTTPLCQHESCSWLMSQWAYAFPHFTNSTWNRLPENVQKSTTEVKFKVGIKGILARLSRETSTIYTGGMWHSWLYGVISWDVINCAYALGSSWSLSFIAWLSSITASMYHFSISTIFSFLFHVRKTMYLRCENKHVFFTLARDLTSPVFLPGQPLRKSGTLRPLCHYHLKMWSVA